MSDAGPSQGAKAPSGGSAGSASVGAHNFFPAEAIWEGISPSFIGFTVEILPEIDSSNSELMRRARAGRTDPVLLVAEQQTAGRAGWGAAGTAAPAIH